MTAPALLRNTTVMAAQGQVSADIGGEIVILDLASGSYLTLGGVGVRIWELLSQPRAVSEIEDTVLREFEVEVELCRHDVQMVLRGLADRGVIEINGPV